MLPRPRPSVVVHPVWLSIRSRSADWSRCGSVGRLLALAWVLSVLVIGAAQAQDVMPLPGAGNEIQVAHQRFVSTLEAGELEDAVGLARATLHIVQHQEPSAAKTVARAHYNLVLARWRSLDLTAAADFVDVLARFEAVFGPDSAELIQPLIMVSQSGIVFEAANGSRNTLRFAFARSRELERRARRLALDQFGRNTIPFLEYELRTARASLPNERVLRSIHSRISKLGREGVTLYARASDEYANSLMRNRNVLGVIEVLQSAIDRLDEADVVVPSIRRQLYGRMVQAYEMLGQRDAATEHGLAYARYSEDASTAQLLFSSEYQNNFYERRFPTAIPVRVTVDEAGFVTEAELLTTEGFSQATRDQAIAFAFQQRFAPRLLDGRAVADTGLVTVVRVDDSVLSRRYTVPCKTDRERSALQKFLDWSCRNSR